MQDAAWVGTRSIVDGCLALLQICQLLLQLPCMHLGWGRAQSGGCLMTQEVATLAVPGCCCLILDLRMACCRETVYILTWERGLRPGTDSLRCRMYESRLL